MNAQHPAQTSIPTARRLPRWPWALPILAAVLVALRAIVPAGNGLDARYFAGPAPAGTPARSAVERVPSTAQVRRAWGANRPDVFAVTWSGYFTVPAPGTFEFATASDDGSQLFVDDQLIVDNSGTHALQTRTGQVRLTSGSHRVRLLFVNTGGDFAIRWLWARAGEPLADVPAWLLSTGRTRYGVALTARVLESVVLAAALAALAALGWLAFLSLRDSRPGWATALADGCAHDTRFFVLHACVRRAVVRRASAAALPGAPGFIPDGVRTAAGSLLAVVAALLPVFFIGHALLFWGHGVIDQEATTFVINYLADRPFLQAIFDPRLNDWGSFQARELAYVFDRMDARLFARLLVDDHLLVFVPLSSVLSLLAVTGIYLFGARRILRLHRTTSLLLLSLFLSCIVTQASTPILYRSSKMLLSVALLAFMFRLLSLLEPGPRAVNSRNVAGLFVLGVLMGWCDRQGYAFLLAITTILFVLWIRQRWLPRPAGEPDRAYLRVAIGSAAATAWTILYNNVIAPRTILWANGYWPDMSYEDIPLERFNAGVVASTLRMFRDQASFFFGNAPFVLVCVLAFVMWLLIRARQEHPPRGVWQRLTSTGFIVSGAFAGATLVLIAVMGMRHPPIFRIVDHAFWYYTLSMQAALLFAASLVVAQVRTRDDGRERWYGWLLLIVMIAGNVAHYPAQRRLMEASGDWFGKQYAFAQLYARSFEVDRPDMPDAARVVPSWIRVGGNAGEVDLPLASTALLDSVRAAYTTLRKRPPLADAGGPYWSELRAFLDSSAAPFVEPGRAGDTLEALQSIGIRRVVIRRGQYDAAAAGSLVDAARARTDVAARISDTDSATVIELSDTKPGAPAHGQWRAMPASAFTLSASRSSSQLPLAVDGDRETEWNSTAPQDGTEWIRADFGHPTHIAGVRLTLTDAGLDRYPRRLAIESRGPDGGTRTLFDGSTLPALFRGILTMPTEAPIELAFVPTGSSAIVIRQTGRASSSWALRELAFFEAPGP